ncbi:MAG: PKD domain-containing protein, partial [Vicingaceae bacterium]|nr:PKD domain-containing protein [Vicingaceae bacterium]
NPMQFYDSTSVLSGSISNWLWNFGDGDTSIAQNPTHIYTTSGTKDVTLTVTSSLGCDYSLVLSVIVNDAPVAGFTFGSGDHSIDDAVSFIDQSTGATSWLWDFGDGTDSSTASNPVHTYITEGIYIVTQTVFNNLGCSDKTSLEITIQDLKVFPPVLPTGFSPNGDGENDVLLVRGGPFKSVHLVVYNNWGNLIFESEDAEIGWDGSWNGTEQFAGDYVYTVKAVTIDDKEYIKHGSVSIIR